MIRFPSDKDLQQPRASLPLFAAALLVATVCANAELLVSGLNTGQVFRYDDTNGTLIDVFIAILDGALNLPRGLALGPDGASMSPGVPAIPSFATTG